MPDDNLNVTMVRENLDQIPDFSLPSGFNLRPYRPGDEQDWLKVQTAADRYNTFSQALFDQQFGDDRLQIAERQLYLFNAHNMAIGTASAWFDDNYRGEAYGRVHWVAILPERQGFGLAKPLMTATLQLLKTLGHKRAYLTTSTARFQAINLYLQFGFMPEIDNGADLTVWRELLNRINKPGILSS